MNDQLPNPLPDKVADQLRGTFHAEHGAQVHRMEAGTSTAAPTSRWTFRRLLLPAVAVLAAAGIGGGAAVAVLTDGDAPVAIETELGESEPAEIEAPQTETVFVEAGPERDLDTAEDAAQALENSVATPTTRSIPIVPAAETAEEQAYRWFDAVVQPTFPLAPSCAEPFTSFEVDGATAIAELCDDALSDPLSNPSYSSDEWALQATFIRAMTEMTGIEHAALLLPGQQRCVGYSNNVNPLCFKPEHLSFDASSNREMEDCNFLTPDGNAVNVASTQVAKFAYEEDAIVGADAGDTLVKVAPGVIINGAFGSLEPETPVVLRHEPGSCVVMDRSVWWKVAWDQENDGWIEARGLWEYGADHGLAAQAPVVRENSELRRPPSPCETTPAEDARVGLGIAPDDSSPTDLPLLQITDIRTRALPDCLQVEIELANLEGVGSAIFADRLADGEVSLIGNEVVFGRSISAELPGIPPVQWAHSGSRGQAEPVLFDSGGEPFAAIRIGADSVGPAPAAIKVRIADNPARVYVNVFHVPTAPATDPTGSSTITECADEQKQQQAHYDVVNVAPDDPDGGLVVHREPGASTPVISVLPWNAAKVTSRSGCKLVDGTPWWNVPGPTWSSDSSGGWVNASFLGNHRTAEDQLGATPCSVDEGASTVLPAADGQLDVSPRPEGADRLGVGAAGRDGFHTESAGSCHRLIIPLTEIRGVDTGGFEDIHTVRADAVSPTQFAIVNDTGGSLDIAVGAGISPVDESSTRGQWVGRTWTDEPTGRSLAAYYTAAQEVDGSSGTVRVLYGSGQAAVRIADNPARLIVDITVFPDPVGQRSGPVVGAGTVLYAPIQSDLEGPGVDRTVTVRGYGHGFEGTLNVTVLPWDGESWPEDVLIQRDAGLLSPVMDAVQVRTANGELAGSFRNGEWFLGARGEFSFDIEFFEPGSAWQIMVAASNPAPEESGLGHLTFLGAGQQIRVADPDVPADGRRYPEAIAFGTLSGVDF